jgi:hypothetical protein
VVSPLIATGALLRRCGDGRGLVDEATALLKYLEFDRHAAGHRAGPVDSEGESDED